MLDKCEMIAKYKMIEGYVFAAFTDELIIGEWKQSMDSIAVKWDRLLELRIFNEEMEAKCYRASIGREFFERIIDRNNEDQSEFYEETQILDIDTLRSKEINQETGDVLATGGGRYHLPVAMTESVSIVTRQYIHKNEFTGQAEVFDWRLVKFAEAEELKNGKIC